MRIVSVMKPWMRLAPDLSCLRGRTVFGSTESGAVLASQSRRMTGEKVPTWDEIRSLIERADEVCRESEYLRAQAERARRRPYIWPERRQPVRQHGIENRDGRRAERESSHEEHNHTS